jgi:AraC-like DNA-binding protein
MQGTEPIVLSRVLYGLEAFLGAEVSLDGLLEASGLQVKAATLQNDDSFLPMRNVADLFERAAEATGRPCFGIEFADSLPVGATGQFGFLIANAPTARSAFENVAQYISAVTRPMTLAFAVDAQGIGHLTWRYPDELAGAVVQYASVTLTLIIKRLRFSAGDDWVPMRLDLMHRQLPCASLVKRYYGDRVRFNQSHYELVVDPTTLARVNPRADALLYRAVRMGADAEIAGIASPNDTIASVRRMIQQHLSQGPPDLEQAALAMGLKKGRQLQWKLEQEGTTFEKELSETRRVMAERLLSTTDLSMTQIAESVGFSELSSFTRAAKLWFGVTPREYRAKSRPGT